MDAQKIENIELSSWEKLSRKRIFFGHQSVGENILRGMRILQEKYVLAGLKIADCDNLSKAPQSFFAHCRVGQNGNPESKIDDFSRRMKDWENGGVDLAFFKFCYVDITSQTDVGRLFLLYEKNMNSLKEKFPETGFIHFTAPLKTADNRPQSWLKKIIGSPETDLLDNIQRNRFNEEIRRRYGGEGTLFDLAEAEAIRPDGLPSVFHYGGKNYACLAREYSVDGGHLNEKAAEIIAEKFLIILAGKAA